jgi:hypothetical protein
MDGARSSRWLSSGLFLLGSLLAATSSLGPLGFDAIHYRVSSLMRSQLEGVDATSLLVAAPLCVVLGVLAARRHRAVPALALAPALYTLYMVTETITGPDYAGTHGNNERYFPLFICMFVLAAAVTVGAWQLIDPGQRSVNASPRIRVAGGLLVLLGVLLVIGRYLPTLGRVAQGEPASADYLAGPSVFWTVALEDLGIVIPAMITAGLGMWRSAPWVGRLRYAVVGWAALVPLSVAVMAIAMYLDDQPTASLSSIALLSGMAAVFLIPAAICYPPLFTKVPEPTHSAALCWGTARQAHTP